MGEVILLNISSRRVQVRRNYYILKLVPIILHKVTIYPQQWFTGGIKTEIEVTMIIVDAGNSDFALSGKRIEGCKSH